MTPLVDSFRKLGVYLTPSSSQTSSYPIVRNACLAPGHHDIIDYYGDNFVGVWVRYVEAEFQTDEGVMENTYIEVTGPDNLYISIQNGTWTLTDPTAYRNLA
jgi:hypothetical protein